MAPALLLGRNPWNCTCGLLRVRELLRASGTDVRGGRCAAPAEHKGESWMWSRTIVQQCQPLLRPGAAGPSTHKGEDKEVDEDTAGLAEEEDEDYEVE